VYRVYLNDEQREELQRRAHEAGVRPRTRDRLEMVRLSDAGWSVPTIARHLGLCQPTVRHWLKTFLVGGFDALPDQPPVGRTSRLTPAIRDALRQELAKGDRTWTAKQLAAWIEEQYGVGVSASHLRRFRRRWKLSYQRTARSLKHKQKPQEVAAKRADLETLEKGGPRA
jgi:transposase